MAGSEELPVLSVAGLIICLSNCRRQDAGIDCIWVCVIDCLALAFLRRVNHALRCGLKSPPAHCWGRSLWSCHSSPSQITSLSGVVTAGAMSLLGCQPSTLTRSLTGIHLISPNSGSLWLVLAFIC